MLRFTSGRLVGQQIACLPDVALDDPLDALPLLDSMTDDKGLDAAIGVDKDIAATATMQSVDDAAAVSVEVPLRTTGGEEVEDRGGETAGVDVEAFTRRTSKGCRLSREGFGWIRRGNSGGIFVRLLEISTLHVRNQGECADEGADSGSLGLRGAGEGGLESAQIGLFRDILSHLVCAVILKK